jgi:hypothetical protein
MSPKRLNNPSALKEFVMVAEHPELTIFSEYGQTTIYNPKNKSDLDKLCKVANLEEFLKDNEQAEYPHLLIFESSRYARGVVANEFIKKNRIICEYLGEMDSLEEVIDRDRVAKMLRQQSSKDKISFEALDNAIDAYIKHVSAYAFELTRQSGPNDCMLAHRKRSLAAFINHHTTDPNVYVDIVNDSIRYIASRDIEIGEQLRIDYGPDYEYQECLYYIPSTENHLRRGKFLAENLQYYYNIPVKLTKNKKSALGTESDYVMVPKFLIPLLDNHQPKKNYLLTEYEKRLPILEILECTKKPGVKSAFTVFIPENQQNIMPLLLTCVYQNATTIRKLVKDPLIDIFSKTIKDKDALIILLNIVKIEDQFLKLAGPILKILSTNVKRIDYLGSDNYQYTALHILVMRDWCKAVKWFNHKVFFAVVDINDFDPLMLAIAQGKNNSLQALFKLKYVKQHLNSLLLIREEKADSTDYILRRALQLTPKRKYADTCRILLKAVRPNLKVEKKVLEIIRFGHISRALNEIKK